MSTIARQNRSPRATRACTLVALGAWLAGAWLAAACPASGQAAMSSPGAAPDQPDGYPPPAAAAPCPAPLKGQVEWSSTMTRSSPSWQGMPPPAGQDPFAEQRLPAPAPDAAGLPAASPAPRLQGLLRSLLSISGAARPRSVPPAIRPPWLPAYAYSNDLMVTPYHNLDIAWWDKSAIPNRPRWVKLSRSVSRYWPGLVPEPCMVLIAPLAGAPGNFSFASRARSGPRGWLQSLGITDSSGFPLYRYWFDRP